MLALRQNRVYEKYFVASLIEDAHRRHKVHSRQSPLRFPRRMSLRLFDDLYTAPRGGYRDAAEYYQRCSSTALIARIQVPTLILTARDDPFIAIEPFEELTPPAHVLVRIVDKGGHVGFVGKDGVGGIRWAERRVVDWLLRDLDERASRVSGGSGA